MQHKVQLSCNERLCRKRVDVRTNHVVMSAENDGATQSESEVSDDEIAHDKVSAAAHAGAMDPNRKDDAPMVLGSQVPGIEGRTGSEAQTRRQPRRHRRPITMSMDTALRRLGRRAAMRLAIRAGAGRVDSGVPVTVQALVGAITMALMRSAACFAEHSRRRTISLEDVSLAVGQAFRRQLYHGEPAAWK